MSSDKLRVAGETGEGQVSITGSEFIDLVVAKASEEAEARARKRQSAVGPSARWIALLLGLLATGAIGALFYYQAVPQGGEGIPSLRRVVPSSASGGAAVSRDELQRQIDNAVARAVDEAEKKQAASFSAQIEELSSKIEGLAAYQHLSALVTRLVVHGSFSDEERDEILTLLAHIKALGDHATRPGFEGNLKQIIDSFTSAYQVSAVDQLDDMFRAEIAQMSDAPTWLANHYGRVVVSSADVSDRSSAPWKRLKYYAGLSKQNGNPEVALLWDLLPAFVIHQEARSPRVGWLIGNATTFNEEERANFVRGLLEEGTASERDPPDLRRLAEIVAKFISVYRAELAELGIEAE